MFIQQIPSIDKQSQLDFADPLVTYLHWIEISDISENNFLLLYKILDTAPLISLLF
jgi:hypothetical protein